MFFGSDKRKDRASAKIELSEQDKQDLARHCHNVYTLWVNFDTYNKWQLISTMQDIQVIRDYMIKVDIDQYKFSGIVFKLVKPMNYVIIEE